MGRNNYFQFQQFTVVQEKAAMKVGTDGVLLGAWADVSKCQRVLDVGTGTGLLALMIAQRSKAIIDAVEIDHAAIEEACYNVQQSPWAERITVHHSSFQDFWTQTSINYDLIISNPPFFENALKTSNVSRTTARHTDQLPLEDLPLGSKKLLCPKGRLAVILPVKSGKQFIQIAQKKGFFVKRITNLRPKPYKTIHRMLIEFVLYSIDTITEELVIGDRNGEYSSLHKKLTGDFYLKK